MCRRPGPGRKLAAATAELVDSYKDWSAHQTYLHIVSEHEAVDDAETMYRRAMAFAAAREPNEFRAELSDLRINCGWLPNGNALP